MPFFVAASWSVVIGSEVNQVQHQEPRLAFLDSYVFQGSNNGGRKFACALLWVALSIPFHPKSILLRAARCLSRKLAENWRMILDSGRAFRKGNRFRPVIDRLAATKDLPP